MVASIVAGVIATALVAGAAWTYRNRMWLGVLLPAVLIHPREEVRVSIAAVMRLRCGGRHVLFRTPLRPEAFAPPGGVIKYHQDGMASLDSMEFRTQVPRSTFAGRGEGDLRGYVRVSVLPRFLRWYASGRERESDTDALRRELREECQEVGLEHLAEVAVRLKLRYVRRVIEGPSRVGSEGRLQVRVIEVYEAADAAGAEVAKLCGELTAAAGSSGDVLLASDEEIMRGRCGTNVVAHTACYLIGSKPVRPDLPPIS